MSLPQEGNIINIYRWTSNQQNADIKQGWYQSMSREDMFKGHTMDFNTPIAFLWPYWRLELEALWWDKFSTTDMHPQPSLNLLFLRQFHFCSQADLDLTL